jgi:aspartyl-tRNA(Asn)/glutamyl-tRNA(Gln) amidotransferase subunit A
LTGISSGLDQPSEWPPPQSIQWIGVQLRTGALTAAALVDACLERMAAEQPRLNAFICTLAEQARCRATDLDRELANGVDRGPLHGIPISIKDLVDIDGIPTTAASHVRSGHIADRDAAVVAHLRRAGVVFIGKTNLHEFGFGATNEDSAYGPARNPYDATRSPGGSSGGAGASVAAGLALGAVGTDTGGSIRIPASACGVVGLKPSYGELSVEGIVPLSRTLDHVGPLAPTVADA